MVTQGEDGGSKTSLRHPDAGGIACHALRFAADPVAFIPARQDALHASLSLALLGMT